MRLCRLLTHCRMPACGHRAVLLLAEASVCFSPFLSFQKVHDNLRFLLANHNCNKAVVFTYCILLILKYIF